MRIQKRLVISSAMAALCLTAGGAAAIPLNWTKSFTLTGIGTGPTGNRPTGEAEASGNVWTYVGELNDKNQTSRIDFSAATPTSTPDPLNDTLTPINPGNGNPVQYTLDSIVIDGVSKSEVFLSPPDSPPDVRMGANHLTDIIGLVTKVGDPYPTRYEPFDGVGGDPPDGAGYFCFNSALVVYTDASLGGGTWTGICSSDGLGSGSGGTTGPYLGGIYPDPADFANQFVTEASMFEVLFWDASDQALTAENPEAVLLNATVTFSGTSCTGNCTAGPTPSPAPATLGLLGLGLAGLGAMRRRKGAG